MSVSLSASDEDCLAALAALYFPPDSSEDEETACWKAALRQQVEEDLQRQVRLRLGLGLDREGARDTEDEDQHTHTLTRHHHHHQSTYHPHTESPHNAAHLTPPLTPTGPVPGGVSRGEQSGGGEGKGLEEEQRQEEKAGRDVRSEVRKRRVQLSESQAAAARGLGGNAELFQYLSRHHGPPMKQLRQLSSHGSYKTHQAPVPEPGGGVGGRGGLSEKIRWPVEAKISVPTPQHITSTQLSHSQEASDLRQLFGQPWDSVGRAANSQPQREADPGTGREEGDEGRAGRLVYVCGGQEEPVRPGEGDSLVFESGFEGGNLHQALHTGLYDYTLVLTPDLYSKRHVQWYYFRVANMQATPTYTFHIINFMKNDSLYNYGMQPLLYSEAEAEATGMGWRRVGWSVAYHRTKRHFSSHMSPNTAYFTLSWSMRFPHHDDTCYLAHCFPYPLSALQRLLGDLEQDPDRSKYVRQEELCRTLAGNVCPLLTITDFSAEGRESRQQGEGQGGKRGVVVTARVHPGETNSSWMMDGLVSFLTSDSAHAQALRSCFVFKLVPMLNPDGVVVGNYRTSLAGVDLNRVYKNPIETLFPTVYHTKKMIEQFCQEREVCVYVDLHGHSRKHNVFMYGCHTPQADHTHFLYERVLPFLLAQQAPSKFSFASCKFAVQRGKEATGRVVTWRSGVPNSFTLEATFCGSNLGSCSWQFSEGDLQDMGRDLCEALYKFSKCIRSKTYQLKVLAQLAEHLMKKLATPTDHTPTQPSALPDVVTSAAPHPSQRHMHTSQPHRKQAQRTLRRFMKLDMSRLEQESSTSGSDSENEDFKFKQRQHKCKQRNRRRRRSLVSCTQTQLSGPSSSHQPPPPTQPHPPITKTPQPQLTLPSLLDQTTPTRKLRSSAPARLQSTHTLMGTGSRWRFVNRYANRSNGGIPMFAEERLKERTEKRLRSVSEVVRLPPTPSRPYMAATGSHTPTQTKLQEPRPLWVPQTCRLDSIPQVVCPDSIPPNPPAQWSGNRTYKSHTSPRQRHYQPIRDLVEQRSLSHLPTPHSKRHLSRTGHIPACTHLPSRLPAHLPSRLPAHLLTYISEVWNDK